MKHNETKHNETRYACTGLKKIITFISPVSFCFFNVAISKFKMTHVAFILFLLDSTDSGINYRQCLWYCTYHRQQGTEAVRLLSWESSRFLGEEGKINQYTYIISLNSGCGNPWEAVIQGDARVIGGREATFCLWSGKASLNEVTVEPRPGKMKRSWEGWWKDSWKRRALVWALQGGYTMLPLAHSERLLGLLGQKEDVDKAPGLRPGLATRTAQIQLGHGQVISQHMGRESLDRVIILEPAGCSGLGMWQGGSSMRIKTAFRFDNWVFIADA